MTLAISPSMPSRRARSQRSAVRRSCQTMALPTGSPVSAFQTSVVSRWLVMPMPSMRCGGTPLLATASRPAAIVASQSACGSCSTQPSRGKSWSRGRAAAATTLPPSAKTTARELDVPWSMASRWRTRSVSHASGAAPIARQYTSHPIAWCTRPAPLRRDTPPLDIGHAICTCCSGGCAKAVHRMFGESMSARRGKTVKNLLQPT